MAGAITIDRVRALNTTDDAVVIDDGGGSITVDATDLDIRDLDHTTDDITIGDGTSLMNLQTLDGAHNDTAVVIGIAGVRQDAAGSPVSADGDAHPLVFNDDGELKVAADLTSSVADDSADSGNPIKVGGRAQDQGSALSQVSAADDRFDLTGDLYRRLHINEAYNVGWQVNAATVTTTAAEIAATPLDGRKYVTVQNNGSQDIAVGTSGAVTFANGLIVPKKSSASFAWGESLDIYAIADSGSQDVRVAEYA